MAVATSHRATGHVGVLSFDIIADVDGSVPATTLPQLEGYLLAIITSPNSPAATDGYNAVLSDQDGHDLLQGAGAHRSHGLVQRVLIRDRGLHPCISPTDELALVVRGNVVSGATLTIELLYGRGTVTTPTRVERERGL